MGGQASQPLAVALAVMLCVAMVDIRLWMRFAYVIYGIVVLMLLYVDIAGHIGMGAQR